MEIRVDNLLRFFEKVKSISLWQRIFSWSGVRSLSYDAYDEYNSLIRDINEAKNQQEQVNKRVNELERELEIVKIKNAQIESNYQKIENRNQLIENELKKTNEQNNEIEKKNARMEQLESSRITEYQKNIAELNALKKGLEDERNKLHAEHLEEQEAAFEAMKQTWHNHEADVKSAIRNICKTHLINYIEEVPFKGKPDNTIEVAGEYIIFDAKSPSGDDLNNFPKYIKQQTESVNKYAKQENVRSDIFLVIPSNTVPAIKQYTYNLADYNVYVITMDSLEPVILTLKRIEDYEFAQQLTPDERENICRIIGKFAHTAKRRIQIDYFFSYQFLEILSKCKVDLPKEIMESVISFEKAEKLNPPRENRSKQILTQDLIGESEKLALEAQSKLFDMQRDKKQEETNTAEDI